MASRGPNRLKHGEIFSVVSHLIRDLWSGTDPNQSLDQQIVVSKSDLEKINRTSIELLDGSGYMVTLDVFHELHCLVSIGKSLFCEG